MKYFAVLVVTLFMLAFSACTKTSTNPDHTYKVGDTTFNGSYVQLGFSGTDYTEKDATIPTERNIVWIRDLKTVDRSILLSNDSFYIHVVDTFGTYGLGGDKSTKYVATTIAFRCSENQTGSCKIGHGEINQFHPFVHYTADESGEGIVNVFHNDKDFIQGTVNCQFFANSIPFTVSGNFKIYKK